MESAKVNHAVTFEQAVLRAKVAQICDHVGYHAITQDSSNILVDIYRQTIYHLGRHCRDAANNNRRVESTIPDLIQAYDFVGISIPQLQEHIETVNIPLKIEIERDDPKPSNRIQRNMLVDDLLESEKNNQPDEAEDGDGKAPSENGLEDEDKLTVPLLREAYEELSKKFSDTVPVSADKTIRLSNRILFASNTKLKINPPIPPESNPSTSAPLISKVDKKKKSKSTQEQPRATSVKKGKGRRKKKISKEFVPSELNEPERENEIKKSEQVAKLSTHETVSTLSKFTAHLSKSVSPAEEPVHVQQPAAEEGPRLDVYDLPDDSDDDLKMSFDKDVKSRLNIHAETSEPTSHLGLDNDTRHAGRIIFAKNTKLKINPPMPPELIPSTSSVSSKTEKKKKKSKNTEKAPSVVPTKSSKGKRKKISKELVPSVAHNAVPDSRQKPEKVSRLATPDSMPQAKSTPEIVNTSLQLTDVVDSGVLEAGGSSQDDLCPVCSLPYDGTMMIQCDDCAKWYHGKCVNLYDDPAEDETWYCNVCIEKRKPVLKIKTPEPVIHAPEPFPQTVRPIEQVIDRAEAKPAIASGSSQDDLCPECNLADDGTLMIQCDDPFCAKWFHGKCVNVYTEPRDDESWFCKVCVEKQQSAFKRRRRAK